MDDEERRGIVEKISSLEKSNLEAFDKIKNLEKKTRMLTKELSKYRLSQDSTEEYFEDFLDSEIGREKINAFNETCEKINERGDFETIRVKTIPAYKLVILREFTSFVVLKGEPEPDKKKTKELVERKLLLISNLKHPVLRLKPLKRNVEEVDLGG